MLAGDSEDAVELAGRAIDLATAIGAEPPRVGALITGATARANLADYTRVREDLEEACALALEVSPDDASRALVNLGSILSDLGDVEGAIETARRAIAISERTGMAGGAGGFSYGNLVEAQFLAGDWDDAVARSVSELERATRLGGLYQAPLFELVLAEVGLSRDGRVDEAVEIARRQLPAARERNDDQAIFGIFSLCAWTFARTGLEDEAGVVLDEIFARRRARSTGVAPGFWTVACALTLERLGRAGEVLELPEPEGSRFLAAARELDAGGFGAASEILREIGARPFEAEARLLAARAARGAGDAAAAEAEHERARELLLQLDARARLAELASGLTSRSGGS
jgi:tetratricopeptide repeat protein